MIKPEPPCFTGALFVIAAPRAPAALRRSYPTMTISAAVYA